MASKLPALTAEEMAVDDCLGYPKAFAKICRSTSLGPYSRGPPSCFLPYALQPQEALRVKELNGMFPVVDPDAPASANPRGFVNLLWKQLDHLGNAGFDPALFRVDVYGNVLYLHADSASPLAWDVDHWFPCARGGKTVPSNLRILQSQVCKRKSNNLEFLVPWWDLQIGISENHFLSIFASKNQDFRNRAFSFLFGDGPSEELNSLQAVDSHAFPQHFADLTKKVGLAAAAVVSSRGTEASVLRPLDANRSLRPTYPIIAAIKPTSNRDENHSPKNGNAGDADGYGSNAHNTIATAVDSLRQMQEAKKKQAKLNELDREFSELKQKNDADQLAIRDLEALLIKKKRRVEKCRRLAEAQSSYKSVLEKMIRDAMHQSVVYKEQLRLNQAATSSLMARLEAQRAICDSSESELCRKAQHKDEIEQQINHFYDQAARKRSRTEDVPFHTEERFDRRRPRSLYSGRRSGRPSKELRTFLEEEQSAAYASNPSTMEKAIDEASEESFSSKDSEDGQEFSASKSTKWKCSGVSAGEQGNNPRNDRQDADRRRWDGQRLKNADKCKSSSLHWRSSATSPYSPSSRHSRHHYDKSGYPKERLPSAKINLVRNSSPVTKSPHHKEEEGEEEMQQQLNKIGKGNVEKWLNKLMENSRHGCSEGSPLAGDGEADVATINKGDGEDEIVEASGCDDKIARDRGEMTACGKSFEGKERDDKKQWFARSDSSRRFRSLPSSPSMVFGMKKGPDCMGQMSKAMDDNSIGYSEQPASSASGSKFIKRCTQAIRKAVNTGNK